MAEVAAARAIDREIQEFLDHCLDVDKSIVTVESYRQVLTFFSRWISEAHPEVSSTASITVSHLQQFRRHLRLESAARGREMAPSTQAKYLSVLRSWLRYIRRSVGTKVIGDEIPLPKRRSRSLPPRLSDEDLARLIAQPNPAKIWGARDRAIIAVLMSTGLKVSELCALDRRQIREDLLGSVPALPVVLPRGSRRSVILDERSQHFLRAYLEMRKDSYPPLFIRHKPGKRADNDDPEHRLTRQMVNKMLEQYSRAARLPFLVSPRMLRSSAG